MRRTCLCVGTPGCCHDNDRLASHATGVLLQQRSVKERSEDGLRKSVAIERNTKRSDDNNNNSNNNNNNIIVTRPPDLTAANFLTYSRNISQFL